MADRLDQLDYYTLLRVEDDAPADAIREAFHAFALKYHPDRFAGAPEAKRERAAQIYRRGAEGYRVLMNAEARRRYDECMREGRLRLTPEQERATRRRSSSGRLTVRSPRARPFATKALQAYKRGDYKTAKLNLKMALNHEPDNAVLKARLADVEQRLSTG
jgi:curved DNA-binding protein CbpA